MKIKYEIFVLMVIIYHASNALANYESGLLALKKQEYMIASKEFEAAAKDGIPEAQFRLGLLYEEGFGVNKDYNKALSWYREAAALGSAAAMEGIANFYAHGYAVKKDWIIAIDWLRKSSEAGNPFAWLYYKHSPIHFNTDDSYFKEQIAQTEDYFRRKAENGDVIAQTNLGYMYYSSMIETPDNIETSYSQAEGWFRKAAEKGNASAQNLLGEISNLHGGDQIESEKWYRLAAIQGNASSQYNLALIYLGPTDNRFPGKSVSKNIAKAKEWALKSSIQGYVPAQSLLGMLLISTGNSNRDYAEALVWLQKAVKRGDTDAQIMLGDVYVTGKGVKQDYNQAINWYRKAIDLANSGRAYVRLGLIYEEGLGVPKDAVQALQYYEKALTSDSSIRLDGKVDMKLASMYENGIGTTKNVQKSLQHYVSAASWGDIDAMKKLQAVFEKRPARSES